MDDLESARDVNAMVHARITAMGGTPLYEGETCVFLARADDRGPPRIVGDFNDGGYAESALAGDGSMRRIARSDWHVLRVHLAAQARIEYLVRRGDELAPDEHNPERVTTFGTVRSVASAGSPRHAAPPTAAPASNVRQFSLASAARGNTREVTVYLPPGYEPRGPRLPCLYIKDGSRFRDAAGMPALLDRLITTNRLPPLIAVFVDPINRALEYGTAASYRRFVVDELVAEVERRFAAGGDPRRRGLFGASRGGLAVVDLLVQHPEVFGFAAAMSPALSPLPVLQEIAAKPTVEGNFMVLVSRYDTPKLVREGHALVAALRGRATTVIADEMPIDHSIHGWKRWLEPVLTTWVAQMALR